MPVREFTGFGGVKIIADVYGREDHPCVLLLPGGMQSRRVWRNAAIALARAGRYVVSIDLRGHGDSEKPADKNYSLDAFIADLVAVLAQLSSRPVIVGSTLGGWIALIAIGEAKAPLATGLVLTNPPPEVTSQSAQALSETVQRRFTEHPDENAFVESAASEDLSFSKLDNRILTAAKQLKIPTLIVRGAESDLSSSRSAAALAELIPVVEIAEIEGGGHYVAFDNADEFNAVLLEFMEQYIPRDPPEFVAGSDSRTLRDAMGCFATGVTVVTTLAANGEPVGLTANSFTSVSLDPPLVLVCLDKKASTLPAFGASKAFAINVLHIGQQPVSNLFASKGVDRFANTDWTLWDQKAPIIENSLANFECMKRDEIEQGDHIVLVGEVVRARFEQRKDPLLYYSGKYRRLHFG